jgi:hypothetical protein
VSAIPPAVVYALCFLTSAACAWLLVRSYRRSRARLLLWSGGCFVLLAANNLVVIFDMIIVPTTDFRLLRLVLAMAAVGVLLFGFVWDLDEDRR